MISKDRTMLFEDKNIMVAFYSNVITLKSYWEVTLEFSQQIFMIFGISISLVNCSINRYNYISMLFASSLVTFPIIVFHVCKMGL